MTRQGDPAQPRGHYRVQGNLKPGTVTANPSTHKQIVATAGASRIRGRMLSTGGGTWSFRFVQPVEPDANYAQNNPADVVAVGGTETKFDIDPHFGEGLLEITFTSAAVGVISYCDISEV